MIGLALFMNEVYCHGFRQFDILSINSTAKKGFTI